MATESPPPERYGVIGYPVTQSHSPTIHQLFAAQTGHNIQYERLQVAPEKLEVAVRQFQFTDGKGLNVTVPHKRAICRLTNELSDRAKLAGAANTLTITKNRIKGDNTDGIGLVRDLETNLDIDLAGKRLLILGAGGATRGILAPILNRQPDSILIANRTLERATELAERFENLGAVSACRFDAVASTEAFDLVINATSAGVHGETPPYPVSAMDDAPICYDLSYAMKSTTFATWASQHGASKVYMGWGMLVEQAAESFYIWRGLRPDTTEVLRRLSVEVTD